MGPGRKREGQEYQGGGREEGAGGAGGGRRSGLARLEVSRGGKEPSGMGQEKEPGGGARQRWADEGRMVAE